MKYNFSFVPKNLDGTDLLMPDNEPVQLNKLMAQWLMSSPAKSSDITKYYNWATDLYKTGEVDLDKVGVTEFRKFIDNLENTMVLLKGIILAILKDE